MLEIINLYSSLLPNLTDCHDLKCSQIWKINNLYSLRSAILVPRSHLQHPLLFPSLLPLGRKCGLDYFGGMKDEVCYLVDRQQ